MQGAVDVSVGRQLFVDDLLVESVDGVVRCWNHPTKIAAPFVWPESGAAPKRVDGSSGARPGEAVNLTCATDGGLWWDPTRRKFRLWYNVDWLGDCAAFSRGDSTKKELRFKGGDLSILAGKPVRFRIIIHCGTLYSFWVSPSERGESCGYVAGGGPAYKGLRDL